MQLLRIESAKVRKSERIISLSIIGNIVVNPSLASLTSVGTRFRILLLTSCSLKTHTAGREQFVKKLYNLVCLNFINYVLTYNDLIIYIQKEITFRNNINVCKWYKRITLLQLNNVVYVSDLLQRL